MGFADFTEVSESEEKAFMFSLKKTFRLSESGGVLFKGSKSFHFVLGRGLQVVDIENITYTNYVKDVMEMHKELS